jgi:VIT1/CCC1 family predicted Fe2+/Mn2+ transporter
MKGYVHIALIILIAAVVVLLIILARHLGWLGGKPIPKAIPTPL